MKIQLIYISLWERHSISQMWKLRIWDLGWFGQRCTTSRCRIKVGLLQSWTLEFTTLPLLHSHSGNKVFLQKTLFSHKICSLKWPLIWNKYLRNPEKNWHRSQTEILVPRGSPGWGHRLKWDFSFSDEEVDLGIVDVLVAQSCLTLCDPMDCSPPGSSVHGISQTRILEWVAIFSSRGSSHPRNLPNPCLLHWQEDSLPLSHL